MSNTDLTAFVEWWDGLVIRLASAADPDKVFTRVAPGGLTIKTPKSIYQYTKKYKAMTAFTYDPAAGSDFLHVFLTLILCSFTEPSLGYEGQCYNNILADLKLNGGSPDKSEIYAWVDVFTWKGFIEEVLPFMLWNVLFLYLAKDVAKISWIGWYFLFNKYPLCVAEDGASIFGTPCETINAFSKSWY